MTAWVDDFDPNQQAIKEIMAIEHRWLPLYGVQFHPESLMTEYGHRILENFLTHPNNAWIS
jgi:anthranilate/para-aminobenzoate synthase component II